TAGSVDLSGLLAGGNVSTGAGTVSITAANNISSSYYSTNVTLSTSGANGTSGSPTGGTGGQITMTAGGNINVSNLTLQSNGGTGFTPTTSGTVGGTGG